MRFEAENSSRFAGSYGEQTRHVANIGADIEAVVTWVGQTPQYLGDREVIDSAGNETLPDRVAGVYGNLDTPGQAHMSGSSTRVTTQLKKHFSKELPRLEPVFRFI